MGRTPKARGGRTPETRRGIGPPGPPDVGWRNTVLPVQVREGVAPREVDVIGGGGRAGREDKRQSEGQPRRP